MMVEKPLKAKVPTKSKNPHVDNFKQSNSNLGELEQVQNRKPWKMHTLQKRK
jgi:hypothetical protein